MYLLESAPEAVHVPPMGDVATAAAPALMSDFVDLVGRIAPIDIEPADVARESTLAGDLMLDSISLISLMALAEAHFGVALSEHSEDVANLRTLGDAHDLLARLDAAGA